MKWLAIRHLENIVSPMDRAVWARDYEVEHDWLLKAYASLGVREEPISDDEGARLGLQTSLRLGRLRERIRKRKSELQRDIYSPRPASSQSIIYEEPYHSIPPKSQAPKPFGNGVYTAEDIKDTKAEFHL